MSDLIERLRTKCKMLHQCVEMRREAADEIERLQARVETLEGAALDLFVHDKRETRTKLRDLVGGFDAVAAHRAASEQGESDHTMTEHTEFCEAWRGRACTCEYTEQGESEALK